MSAPQALVLTAPRELRFVDVARRPLRAGEVRIRSRLSAISHGTELNHYRGTAPFRTQEFDLERRMFVARPDGAERFPVELGYGIVGEVLEIGDDVTSLRPGDTVYSPTPHSEESIAAVEPLAAYGTPLGRLPEGAPLEPGLYASLAVVALRAIHDSGIRVGDAVAVYGLGTIGLLTLQLARRAGAGIVVGSDPVASRRELASAMGASATIDPSADDPVAEVKRLASPQGPDVAIETSGTYPGLGAAIAGLRVGGRVVTVGYYSDAAAPLRLGEAWHHNRLTMVSSMGVWGVPHRDCPLWDAERVTRTAIDLLYRPDGLDVTSIPIARFPFRAAPQAYAELDADPGKHLKVVLEY